MKRGVSNPSTGASTREVYLLEAILAELKQINEAVENGTS